MTSLPPRSPLTLSDPTSSGGGAVVPRVTLSLPTGIATQLLAIGAPQPRTVLQNARIATNIDSPPAAVTPPPPAAVGSGMATPPASSPVVVQAETAASPAVRTQTQPAGELTPNLHQLLTSYHTAKSEAWASPVVVAAPSSASSSRDSLPGDAVSRELRNSLDARTGLLAAQLERRNAATQA